MSFGTIFIIGVVIVVVGFAMKLAVEAANRSALSQKIASKSEFKDGLKHISRDGLTAIALNERGRTLYLSHPGDPDSAARIISYRDILSVELMEDGYSVAKTSRSSQAGGALLGALVAGPAGFLIGGLSAKQITHGKVKRIDLALTINDPKSPLFVLNFMNWEDKKDGPIYRPALEKAREWAARINVLIRIADQEDGAPESPGVPTAQLPLAMSGLSTVIAPASNVADELRKLSELVKDGFLTQDEFALQKEKLLNLG